MSKITALYRLFRNRCPACNSNGQTCHICYNDSCYFSDVGGKRLVWWRWKNDQRMEQIFAEIDAIHALKGRKAE